MSSGLLRVELVPIFEDNYVFILLDEDERKALIVDPGEAAPLVQYLKDRDLTLNGVLLTHHHNDHIGGVKDLVQAFKAPVYAPLKNKNQIPFASEYVQEGDKIQLGNFSFAVMELPGHTLGHVAYWCADKKWLFSGDVLFGLGCGRLFEGTYDQMYHSLQRIKALPPETLVYCTHEYTETNLQFCKMLSSLDDSPITGDDEDLELYENELTNRRGLDIPSVPLKLFIEKKVNPFLLARNVQQFTYLRELRNKG
ncbi:hydroxyacylglutathione hydrolase [Bdellovibrio bacteriovorus]|uniref:Hydroxyacylglutathione hydrolase n=1 Tax=Bdellovibrio bacteriovorus TaxID=959 RepID=A0A161PQE3_BDEBC|nr:hydroxyacylglutathione hydrolase [Bdellovibrio bacteriovorus]KYG65100.1 hydroxyacylglutathione hydrolase [Bdellovibrio bacteriovorus]